MHVKATLGATDFCEPSPHPSEANDGGPREMPFCRCQGQAEHIHLDVKVANIKFS